MSTDLLKALEPIQKRFDELTELMADPAVITDMNKYRDLSKEHADKTEILAVAKKYKQILKMVEENRELRLLDHHVDEIAVRRQMREHLFDGHLALEAFNTGDFPVIDFPHTAHRNTPVENVFTQPFLAAWTTAGERQPRATQTFGGV